MMIKEALYVYTVAKYENVTRAAEELYISQPSLSKYIMTLEQNLGVKLFNRVNNRLKPTFSGEKYIEAARQILNINSNLEKQIYDIENLSEGKITIGIPQLTGNYVLPMILPPFQKKYPGITVKLYEANSKVLEEATINYDVDFSILHLPLYNPELDYKLINHNELVLAAHKNKAYLDKSEKHINSKYPFIDIKLLEHDKFILLYQGQRIRQFSDELFKRYQMTPNVILETSNALTAYFLACNEYGVTIIPDNLFQYNFNSDVDIFSLKIPENSYDLGVCFIKNGYLSRATKIFISMLCDLFS